MLTFVIPVKSKLVSNNWSEFCNLFQNTLKSVTNQTDSSFKVVVVCNEIPDIEFKHPSVHYLKVDFNPPLRKEYESDESINKRREIDKGKKLKVGVKYATDNFNTDYVMTVDSDDFISKKIAAFVNGQNGEKPGWYTIKGYIYVKGKPFLLATSKFNSLCGSSVIVRPELIEHFCEIDPILYFDHRMTVLNNDIYLDELPFYGGIYSVVNGENHLMSISNVKKFNNHKGWMSREGLRRILVKLRSYSFKFITKNVINEFGFIK
ncbi:glycosyltransferase family 2 protein [Winogradskyella flava]|uniref:Glycosyltransferase family 2 protein n=1 Tax=Winogradskyella flava TaxID=1884876 RepID=A0A842IVJ4_9FLAO|nr:glycosyltransferase family 2 protein [Winogradskyella flava]MBC2845766.1 glycosyltransferase family 2 protein [Winogradskyella flava]